MANLVRALVDLATDEAARERFSADPRVWVEGLVAGVPGEISVEDVLACAAIARRIIDPAIEDRLPSQTELAGDMTDAVGTAEISARLAAWVAAAATAPMRGHLHAVDAVDDEGAPVIDPEHPAVLESDRPGLAAVPDGAPIGVLDLVVLVDGVPGAGVEPGTEGTVVAVHRDDGLAYEVEVAAPDGARLFLGIVPASAVTKIG